MTRDTILLDIVAERFRQDRLCAAGKFPHTLASTELAPEACLTVLAEEFGEVSRPVADMLADPGRHLDVDALRDELVQLAACCVAWLEQLDGVRPAITPYRDSEAAPVPVPEADRPAPAIPEYHQAPSYVPACRTGAPPARGGLADLVPELPDYGGAL